MTEEREMTAPMTSVGAEVGQSPDLLLRQLNIDKNHAAQISS